MRWKELRAIAAIALVLFVLSFNLAAGRGVFRDEHQNIAAAALIARDGLLPYKDYAFFHLPYLPFVYAAIFLFTDHLVLAARMVSVVCAAATGLVLFGAARRIFQDRSGQWAVPLGAVALLFTCLQFTHSTGYAWNQEPVTLCALFWFVAYLESCRSSRPALWIFLGALALGFGIGFRVTIAPLAGAFVLLLIFLPPAESNRTRLFGAAALGLALALLPIAVLFAQAPEQFIFGNIEFIRLARAFHQNVGHPVSVSNKLEFLVLEIVLNLPLLNAVGFALFMAKRETRAVHLPFPRELKALFVTLPFLLMGALAPSPVYRQYFYPLFPFLVLTGVCALERIPDSSVWWRRTLWFSASCVIASTLLAASSYRFLREIVSPGKWEMFQIHGRGVELCQPVPRNGRVFTLSPIWPLEANLSIFPELATGPFGWRVTSLVAPERRARLKLLDLPAVEHGIAINPPAAFLFGEEKYLEPPLRELAQAHSYELERAAEMRELWIPRLP